MEVLSMSALHLSSQNPRALFSDMSGKHVGIFSNVKWQWQSTKSVTGVVVERIIPLHILGNSFPQFQVSQVNGYREWGDQDLGNWVKHCWRLQLLWISSILKSLLSQNTPNENRTHVSNILLHINEILFIIKYIKRNVYKGENSKNALKKYI